MGSKVLAFSIAAVAAVALLIGPSGPAQAGCGCDHPPPGYAALMPAFGSPGKPIRVNRPSDQSFVLGAEYAVRVGGVEILVVADADTHLMFDVPPDAEPGPSEIEVTGDSVAFLYGPSEFTVLTAAPLVPDDNGLFTVMDFEASVSADGTLLVPFNLTDISDGTQFMVLMRGLPLTFDQEDVVFFNADGVDLTLFTLAVDDPTQRQWGSYFGWDVEQDRGLFGTIYQNKIVRAILGDLSDELTYWRHEFHSYKQAHLPGGSHEVSESGHHVQDGTLHVDHDHLVLAVNGQLRDGTALSPGSTSVDVFVLLLKSPVPLEPEMMSGQLAGSLSGNYFSAMLREQWGAYRRNHDDD